MNDRTIKFIIILSAVSLTGLIITQLFWIGNAFKIAGEQYDHRVNMALDDAVREMAMFHDTLSDECDTLPGLAPEAGKPGSILKIVPPSKLKSMLDKYVEYHNLDPSFEFEIIKTSGDSVIYQSANNIPKGTRTISYKTCLSLFYPYNIHHLKIYFPAKKRFFFLELSAWMAFSIIFLVIIMVTFTLTILGIIRQKKLTEIKNDFINNMTHEFKTPISTISLAAEVLKKNRGGEQGERVRKYANIIFDENNRMRDQVEKVLHVAAMEKNEFQLHKEMLEVDRLIKNAVHNLCLNHCEKPASVNYHFHSDDCMIEADQVYFTNIIVNLVDNALKYSKDHPEIDIYTRVIDKYLEIKVADKGIGMEPDKQKLIFERFYRVPTGNVHDVKGFGLGLYYVKMMTEAHGGTVKVQSEPGKGSCFILFFPLIGDKL
ncbi:MAG: sensor histidine kinase [Bacteroidales bacterium]